MLFHSANDSSDNKSKNVSFSGVLEAASNGQFAADDRKLKVG
jgi:hypothetical protein